MSTQANVLIIEDESIIAADLAYIVEQLGLCVFGVAKTCAEAIALARLAPVSLILSDVKLADGSSGITAVEAILEEQNAAVIFVTASPQLVRTGVTEIEKDGCRLFMAIAQAASRQCDCPKLRACLSASPHHQVIHDLSERRRFEARLRELRADRLDLIEHMSVGLAHELKQPLAAISAYLNVLRRLWKSSFGLSRLITKKQKNGFECEFRRNPAGDSDLMSAGVPR